MKKVFCKPIEAERWVASKKSSSDVLTEALMNQIITLEPYKLYYNRRNQLLYKVI